MGSPSRAVAPAALQPQSRPSRFTAGSASHLDREGRDPLEAVRSLGKPSHLEILFISWDSLTWSLAVWDSSASWWSWAEPRKTHRAYISAEPPTTQWTDTPLDLSRPQIPHLKMGGGLPWWRIRICLPAQETWAQRLVREGPMCRGATGPTCRNYWARALEPRGRSSWAHVLQLLKPVPHSPRSATREATVVRSPPTATRGQPPLATTRLKPGDHWRTSTAKRQSQNANHLLKNIF